LNRQPKVASGISVFLLEELGDARLRCAQLKKYVDEAVQLIDKSEHRDHFFEVAGHLLHGIPDTLMRMDKALSAAALAAAKLDYEEIKDDLRPEKVDELEKALDEVRIRRVQRRSSKEARSVGLALNRAVDAFQSVVLPSLRHETREALDQAVADAMIEFARMRAGNRTGITEKLNQFKPVPDMDQTEWVDLVEEAMEMWFTSMKKVLKQAAAENAMMKIPDAIAQLEHLAATVEATGRVDTEKLAGLIAQLEGQTRIAAAPTEISGVLKSLAGELVDTGTQSERPSRVVLAGTLRRILADTMELATEEVRSRFEEGKPADPTENMSEEDAKRWREEHEKNKDQFKEAASGDPRWIHAKYPGKDQDGKAFKAGDLVLYYPRDKTFLTGDKAQAAWRRFETEVADEDVYNATMRSANDEAKRSRFEEGKPADPTENMSEEDAKRWKQQTDEHKDEFKAASGVKAGFRKTPTKWTEKGDRWLSSVSYANDEKWDWEIREGTEGFEVRVTPPRLKEFQWKQTADTLEKAKRFAERYIEDPQGGERLNDGDLSKLFSHAKQASDWKA
jgi:hypothetical protein